MIFSSFRTLNVKIPTNRCRQKGSCHNDPGNGIFLFCHLTRHLIYHNSDHCPDSGLHAKQHLAYNKIFAEDLITDRDCRNDYKLRKQCPKDGCHHAGKPCQLIADCDCSVHCHSSRCRLCDRHQIQHLILIDPVILINKFLFHQTHDHIASAKRECTEIKRRQKKFP